MLCSNHARICKLTALAVPRRVALISATVGTFLLAGLDTAAWSNFKFSNQAAITHTKTSCSRSAVTRRAVVGSQAPYGNNFWIAAEKMLQSQGFQRRDDALKRFWEFVDHNAQLKKLPEVHAATGQKHNRPFYPGLASLAFHPTDRYGELLAYLRECIGALREECLALPGLAYRDSRNDPGWSILNLRCLGKRSTLFSAHEAQLPKTSDFLSHLEKWSFAAPESASLLRQAPGSGLEPHTDCLNMVLCCHVGLSVPSGCWIECGGQRLTWSEGESLIIDQTFVHSTFNPTKDDRIILAFDLWHYDLSLDERRALSALFEFVELWNDSFKVGPITGMHLPYGWYSLEDKACCL